ncbi:MAG: sigma-70 family RNA polymerase sigma factor [Planctomycetota bacterium]
MPSPNRSQDAPGEASDRLSQPSENIGPGTDSLALSGGMTTRLLVASQRGDIEALGQLLEKYRGYLVMLAHRHLAEGLRRRVDPMDIVQITYMEAQRDLKAFRGSSPAEFKAWIRNILKNNVASAVVRHVGTQKRSLKKEITVSPRPAGDEDGASWLGQLPGSRTSPSGVAIRVETAMALLEALHQLPENQAEAIRLRYMEGLSLAEMVELMGKSDTAVAGLLKRGLKKLRTIVDIDNSPWVQ